MKYSLTNRQDPTYLIKADEILIQYRDHKAIPDYCEKYPNATLVVEAHPTDMPINLDQLKEYAILTQGRLTVSLPELAPSVVSGLQLAQIPYFYAYPVSSAWELDGLMACGVSQVRVEAPLFFDTEVLRRYPIKKRVVANVAHEGYIPTLKGIVGSWIRPEDVELYEDIFDIIEFRDMDKKKEQALFRIYAEQHAWPGALDMLITNIGDVKQVNRMLSQDFTKARLTCKQKCMSGSPCRLCERFINLADPDKIKEYINAPKEEITG